MNRKVTPCRWRSLIRANSRAMAAPSSWAVGSSRTMNRAPNDSALAISRNCRCSTSRSPAGTRTSTSTDQVSSSSRARSRTVRQLISPPRPRSCRLRKRFSATVSSGMIVDFW